MSGETWKALALTHVEYIEGDLLGHVLAYISLMPLVIIVSMATLVLFRRDLHTIFFFGGIFVNETINWMLKRTFKEPRPLLRKVIHNEYGMPSSHAQFMFFFTSYMMFFLYVRIYHNCNWRDNMWKHASFLTWLVLSILVCISRIHLMYHTKNQVLIGAVTGILTGLMWFCLVQFEFTPHFSTIACWSISEYLMIRDLTPIPNLLWFEYCTQRNESRSRNRKNNHCKKRC